MRSSTHEAGRSRGVLRTAQPEDASVGSGGQTTETSHPRYLSSRGSASHIGQPQFRNAGSDGPRRAGQQFGSRVPKLDLAVEERYERVAGQPTWCRACVVAGRQAPSQRSRSAWASRFTPTSAAAGWSCQPGDVCTAEAVAHTP